MGDYSDEELARLSGLYGVPVLTMKLNHAIRTGGYGVEDLLNAGASVNAPTLTGATPLQTAAEVGDTYIANKLLTLGAIVNARDEIGTTPLHHAVENSNPKMAALLLKGEADVNAADIYGATPLHIAAGPRGRLETVKLLLSRGADPGAKTNDANGGLTPLHIAGNSRNREKAVGMLVNRPEAAQITDADGNLPRVFPGDPGMEDIQWHVENIATTVAPKNAAARRMGATALLSRRAAEAKKIAEEHERGAPARIARAAVAREKAKDAAEAAARAEAAGKKYVKDDELIYPAAKGAPRGGTRLQRRGRKTIKARKARKRNTMRRRR